jgi:hypothetical protein
MGLNEKDAVWISVSVGIVAILGFLKYYHGNKPDKIDDTDGLFNKLTGGRKTMRSRKYKNRSRKV